MNTQEAYAVLAEKVSQIQRLVEEAEKLAQEHGLSFSFSGDSRIAETDSKSWDVQENVWDHSSLC